jgi:hypothetical protein
MIGRRTALRRIEPSKRGSQITLGWSTGSGRRSTNETKSGRLCNLDETKDSFVCGEGIL